MSSKRRGLLFIISAPSGAGKSTLTNCLLNELENIRYSVSTTTRPKRPGESDGRAYRFTDREQFLEMIDKREFIEFAEVHGNFYGTQRSTVEAAIDEGTDLLLDIDVQGARQIRMHFPEAVSIFVMPPSMKVLEDRLRKRQTDDDATIDRRLLNARTEMAAADEYDYVIVNDDIKDACRKIVEVVSAEREKPRGRDSESTGQGTGIGNA